MPFEHRKIWLPAIVAACVALCLYVTPQSFAAAKNHLSGEAATPLFPNKRSLRDHTKSEMPKTPLGMAQAVEHALARNPSLGAQEAQHRSSEENRKSKRGAFGPKLGMTYSAVKQERKSEPATSRPPEFGSYAWGIEISQPVFQGFRLLANYQKAALQEESDRASLRNAELAMTEQVQTEFLACLAADENVKSESDALARLKDQLRITKAFHEVGLRPKLDVLQAEVDVSQAENTLLQAQNLRDTAYARLNTLIGLPATANIAITGRLAHAPFKLSLEQCLNKAYAKRPDLFIAAKAVDMAKKDQRMAQADYYPQIEAYYNISQRGNSPDLQKVGNNSSRSSTWEVGLTASWNVFQWGVTYYDDRRAGWLVTKMRQEEENLKLNVGYDIKSRLLTLREAEKRIVVSQKAVAQAKEAFDAALARYQEQVGTNFDVLDASSNLTRAQATLTSSRADYLTALAQLYVAMGEFHPDILKP